jgi:hypothetical protein
MKRVLWAARTFLVLVIIAGLMPVVGLGTVGAQQRTLTTSPSSGPICLEVKVCASGLTPDSEIPVGFLTFDGSPWNTRALPVDLPYQGLASMCCSIEVVPAKPPGTYPVQARDTGPNGIAGDADDVIVTGYFTVTRPKIEISPATAYRCEEVTVKGSGWVPRFSPVIITFNGSIVQKATPDGNGRFTTDFSVPLDAIPTNIVGASDFCGNKASDRVFYLRPPSLSVDPTTGPPGITATVTGKGFAPLSPVSMLMFDGMDIMPPGGLATDCRGHFTSPFIVPDVAAGPYLVTAEVAKLRLSTCFRVIGYRAPLEVEPLANATIPVDRAMADIKGQLVRVWGYQDGAWRMYDPQDLAGSNLTGLMKDRAYWVLVSGNCVLIRRELTTGWNLIAW